MHGFFSHLPVPQHQPPPLLEVGRFLVTLQALTSPAGLVGLNCIILLLSLPVAIPSALPAQDGAKVHLTAKMVLSQAGGNPSTPVPWI